MAENPAPNRMPFLIASHEDARREQLFWEEHRDGWLKLVLLAQVVLFALAFGIEVAGVKIPQGTTVDRYRVLLLLAPIVSLILCLMFFAEDRLVALLGAHAAQMSEIERELAASDLYIPTWASSKTVRDVPVATFVYRLVAQLLAFAILPLALACLGWVLISRHESYHCVLFAFDLLAGVLILVLTVQNYYFRKGRTDDAPGPPNSK